MSCNISRFYYCESDIGTADFLRRNFHLRNGVAFDDIESIKADAFEQKLIAEAEDYLRVDL